LDQSAVLVLRFGMLFNGFFVGQQLLPLDE
jgi:hypothetical protein